MPRTDNTAAITEADVWALARVAGLPLDDERAAMLARALEADLRAIRALRDVEVGETFPAEMTPLTSETTHVS